MIETMAMILWIVLTAVLAVGGFAQAKRFVRDRLRYVDLVRRPWFPLVSGALAAAALWPVAWLLPIVTGGTALLFGLGVGLGVSSGRRDFRRLPEPR